MNVNNSDADIIFDLAADLLPGAIARELENSLSTEARAELEAQRSVLAAVAEVPKAAMTDFERSRLHQSVAEAVAEVQTTELIAGPPPPRTRTRAIRWMRLAYGAAAAVVVVGGVSVGSQLEVGRSGRYASITTTTPTALDAQATTAPETVGERSATNDTLTTDTTADGQLFAEAPPIIPHGLQTQSTDTTTSGLGDQYVGVLYSDEAQFNLSSLGGWIIHDGRPEIPEPVYAASHMADGEAHMLWLQAKVGETEDGRAIWEVLDVISLPAPGPLQGLAISGCIADTEGVDDELHGLVELHNGDWTILQAWGANRAEARWEELPIDGLTVHSVTGTCELGSDLP
jgi:hypothetical protein